MRITKDPAERRQELLDASLELFLEKGYEKTAIKDIVQKVGVTQGLLYYYFPSKEDIVKELAVSYKDQFVKQLKDSGLTDKTDPYESIKLMLLTTFRFFEGCSYLIERMHMKGNENLHDRITFYFIDGIAQIVCTIIENGNKSGDFQCPYPREAALALVFGIVGTIHTEETPMMNDLKENKDFIVHFISRVLLADEERLKRLLY